MSLIKEVTEPETSYIRSITNIEMFWAGVGCFPPVVDLLVWEILIEEEGLHLFSIISSF